MGRGILLLALCAIVIPAGSAFGQDTCEDSLYAYVSPGLIHVVHVGAQYNCCPTRFDYDLDVSPGQIEVVENEILDDPCYCLCCYELGCEIADVPAGEYLLEFHWYDYAASEWRVRGLDVSVPGEGLKGDPYVARAYHSDCGGHLDVADEPAPTTTWGTIKSLYR